ncbi:MAG TPA: amino acid adenylation domain-containing protein, partial [Longimicrobiaceae bacterium]
LHAAFGRGEPSPLPELPVQYADYAVWQRERLGPRVQEAQLSYWRRQLAGAPPLLEVPTDRPRAPGRGARAGVHGFALDPELTRGLRALGRSEGATLFMTVLAAWQALLGRHAGQDDVVVGSPVAGRPRVELEGLIGFFVNLLPLRARLGGDPTWRELLGRVRESALGAYAHQELPFERLVEELAGERSPAHAPVFQTVFVLERDAGSEGRLSLGAVETERLAGSEGIAKFDLKLTLVEEGEVLTGALVYREDLFGPETAARMAGHFRTLLRAMVDDPARRLAGTPLLGDGERAQLLRGWNATAAAYPESCVHERVSAQAARAPDAPALVSSAETLTYAELERRANRLAHHLRDLGAGPDARVGLLLERGADTVVAVLAVLKAGAAYVALDPAWPGERLGSTLADAGVRVVVSRGALAARLAGFGGSVVRPDADAEAISARPETAPDVRVSPRNLAYVVYTSGSTGTPRGVLLEHRGLSSYLAWFDRTVLGPEGFALPLVSRLTFDAHVRQLFPPLLRGEAVWVLPEEVVTDPAAILEALAGRERVSFGGVPSLWSAMLELVRSGEGPRPAGLVAVLLGGEALPAELAERTFATFPDVALWNHYGPTEATVNTTAARVRPGERVTIGGPIANARVYLLDAHGEPVPVGVPGELYVGGAGVARGYLGRPELTAERFLPDPFAGEPGARTYRTGDRARWRADGTLEYAGRTDDQVKVRGFRVEPGEVEAALESHPGVRSAAVAVHGGRLVGYIVAGSGAPVGDAELRSWLAARLPEHMVPAAFVRLESLPLSANGKTDRRALPAPEEGGGGRAYAAPRTATEEILCGIWAEVLGLERVGAGEDFFALGGHSLLAARVVSRVREAFGVELPLRALLEAPTVSGLAVRVGALRGAGSGTAPAIVRADRGGSLPLSFAQQRLWLMHRMEPESAAYNMPYALRLRGVLDPGALERALGELVRRHETLRTVFRERGGEPEQVVLPPAPAVLPRVDLRGVPAPSREGAAERLAGAEALRPFDLARGPLLRSLLLRLDDEDHVLCLTLHHVASDGWSMRVLVREVSALYAAFGRGEPSPLAELPVQYADFAVWQRAWLRGEVLEEQLGYWKERLSGAPPLLEVPVDRQRAAGQSPRAASHRFALTPGVSDGLRALSRRGRTTLFMTLLAGWQALLARYAGREDVVVGTPVAGRTRVELEELIGFFVNMLALRAEPRGELTFAGLLERVRETALGAYAHQDLPFERLVEELGVERSLAHAPVFQATFALERAASAREEPSLGAVALARFEAGEGVAKFDLELTMTDGGGALHGVVGYRAALFEAGTVARMAGHLEAVLEAMAADPARRLSGLSLLRGAERAQVLGEWNDTAAELPRAGVHELFAGQAARTPRAQAVLHGGEALSYAELERRSNRLAHLLRGRGVGPESRVGICLERGILSVLSMLAVLKAGGAYVPLAPSDPAERLREVFADAGVSLVLTDAAAGAQLPDSVEPLRLSAPETAAELEAMPESAPGAASDPAQLAYVVYTSGSTGRPKGVAVAHASVVRLVRSTGYVPFGPQERIAHASNLAFDAATFEVWGALLNGGSVVVIERETTLSPAALGAALRRGEVSALFVTTALFNRVAHEEPGAFATLRHLLFGGEAVDPPSVRRVLESGAPGRLLHVYGPTEATTYSSWQVVREVEPGAATVPIGGPLGNTTLYVLDGGGEALPAGVPGELYIGGPGVARGYLGQAALTAERFVPDAFGAAGERLYRTGDRVRWSARGEIEYLGRMDQQVKIRGFRI